MKQYIVDAFTDKVFSGNPAAVCVMDNWISEELMLNIAKENNLSETAFTVKEDNHYKLRWFTPNSEIDLCGHATLGTAFVIMNYYEPNLQSITFHTMSGELTVHKKLDLYEMDFPVYHYHKTEITNEMEQAFGTRPSQAYIDRDLLVVFESENIIQEMTPNQELLKNLDGLAVAITAKGKEYDCVSRVFAPKLNIKEDAVTGSTHCMIAPFWANQLKKNQITAFQASERTGVLYCEVIGNRVKIIGKAVLFSISELFCDNFFSKA